MKKKFTIYFDGAIEVEAENEDEAKDKFNAITDTEEILEAINISEIYETETEDETE